jgi:hypothetical protein
MGQDALAQVMDNQTPHAGTPRTAPKRGEGRVCAPAPAPASAPGPGMHRFRVRGPAGGDRCIIFNGRQGCVDD